MGRKRNKITYIITAVVLVVAAIGMFTGKLVITVGSEDINIKAAYWPDETLLISDIDSVEYVESFDKGSRTNGMGNIVLGEGKFNNDEYGKYTLYAYMKCEDCVVLHYGDRVIALNRKTVDETKELYQEIYDAVENKD